jgi:hypothetical protein
LDYLKTFAEADDSPTRRAWASGMRAHGHDAGKWMPFDVWAHRRFLSTRMECSANQSFVERSELTLLDGMLELVNNFGLWLRAVSGS